MRCPTCGKNVITSYKSYACGCVMIPRVILGKEITPEIVHELLTQRRTETLDGFVSRKNNKTFSAALAIENGRVEFKFDREQKDRESGPTNENKGNIIRIRIHSGNSGSANVTIKGATYKEFQISYGHVSSRMAECLACITAANLIKYTMKSTIGIKLDISLNNLDFSRYILKERVPRDREIKLALESLFRLLGEFGDWTAQYKPEKRPRLAGSPHSNNFPRGVFPGIEVGVEEESGKLRVTLPESPDVRAQFAASLRQAVPDGETYILPSALRSVLMAWINSVKRGGYGSESSRQQ